MPDVSCPHRKQYTLGDSFIGFNDDTPAAVLLETMHDLDDDATDGQVCSTLLSYLHYDFARIVARSKKTLFHGFLFSFYCFLLQ